VIDSEQQALGHFNLLNRRWGEPAYGLTGRDLNGQVAHDPKHFVGNKFMHKTLPNAVENRGTRRKEMLEEPTKNDLMSSAR
jgi:hypothetical protein